VVNHLPASLLLIKQQFLVDLLVALKTKAMPAKKAARKAQEAKMAKAREMRKQTDPGDVPANVRRTQEASAKSKRRDMTGFAQMPFSKQMEYLRTKGKEGTGFKTKEGSTKKKDEMGDYTPFKKGGTVSSASKRGDGIAIRGKTRGRMV
jgi:hypothetical protein